MSERVLARVTVEDFDRFHEVFASRGAEHRSRFGSTGSTVFRSRENPNEVWVVFEWEHASYRDFLTDDTSREIMSAAGLLGPPDSQFVEEVGRHGT